MMESSGESYTSEFKFNLQELPEPIKKSIEKVITRNVSQCLDPIKAKGNCLRISDELMLNLAENGIKPFIDCKILHTRKPQGHFWIFVDGWHIDLTARQFNPNEPCPKIWRHQDVKLENIYSVEKGKGLVLYKLVPFGSPEKSLSKLKRAFLWLKAFVKPAKKTILETLHYKPGINRYKRKYLRLQENFCMLLSGVRIRSKNRVYK